MCSTPPRLLSLRKSLVRTDQGSMPAKIKNRSSHRQAERERRSLPTARRLRPDAAAHPLHKSFRDGQANARATQCTAAGSVDSVKPLEHMREVLSRDAESRVMDAELDCPVRCADLQFNTTRCRCVAQGVAEQIAQHLNGPVQVGVHARKQRRYV